MTEPLDPTSKLDPTELIEFGLVLLGLSALPLFFIKKLGVSPLSEAGAIGTVIYAVTPFFAALLIQLRRREGKFRERFALPFQLQGMGIRLWLLPVLWAVLCVIFALALPSIHYDRNWGYFFTQLASSEAQDASQVIKEQIKTSPYATAIGLALNAQIFGLAIHFVFSLGEELAWRGYLYSKLRHCKASTRILISGTFAGVWQIPLALMAGMFRSHPYLGALLIIATNLVLAPALDALRQRSQSIAAPTLLVAGLTSCQQLTALFTANGSELLIGSTSVPGLFATALLTTAVILWVQPRPNGRFIILSSAPKKE